MRAAGTWGVHPTAGFLACAILNTLTLSTSETRHTGTMDDPMSQEAGSEMGRWLSQMDWSYYVTWTFEEPKAPKVAAGIIKDHLETLDPKKAFWKIEEGDIGWRPVGRWIKSGV